MGAATSLIQGSETRTEAEWHAVLGGAKLDTSKKRTLPQLLQLATDSVVVSKDAEIAALRRELAALKGTGRDTTEPAAVKGAGSDMSGLPAVLRDFTPLSMLDDIMEIADGPELEAAEKAVLANPSADAGELARLSGELAARLGPAIAARSREKGVVHRLRDVVRAGNQDFEKVYSSMFDFIVDDKGLAAYRASMAAVECPGAAARPQRGGKARLDELYQDAARAKPRFDAALRDVIASLPFEVCADTAFSGLKRTPRVIEKAVFKGDGVEAGGCCGVNDFVRAMVVVKTLKELGQLVAAVAASPKLVVVRAKNRIDEPSAGGWRDVLINVYHRDDTKKHVCEVQGCVEQMLKARKGLPGHVVYARVRNAAELLRALLRGRRGALSDLTAAEGKESGLTAAELRAGGFDGAAGAADLKAAGYPLKDLVAAGFGNVDLVGGGFDAAQANGAILTRFFDRMGGRDWGKKGFWGSNKPLASWHGVKTNAATGHVEGLKLESNKLGKGTLADALELLAPLAPTLRSLSLKGNSLGGAIPPNVAAFKEVHTLLLANMRLEGEVPPEIVALVNLHEFVANQNLFLPPAVERALELKAKLPECQYFIMR